MGNTKSLSMPRRCHASMATELRQILCSPILPRVHPAIPAHDQRRRITFESYRGSSNFLSAKDFRCRSVCRCETYRATHSSFAARFFSEPVSGVDTYALLGLEFHTGCKIGGILRPALVSRCALDQRLQARGTDRRSGPRHMTLSAGYGVSLPTCRCRNVRDKKPEAEIAPGLRCSRHSRDVPAVTAGSPHGRPILFRQARR